MTDALPPATITVTVSTTESDAAAVETETNHAPITSTDITDHHVKTESNNEPTADADADASMTDIPASSPAPASDPAVDDASIISVPEEKPDVNVTNSMDISDTAPATTSTEMNEESAKRALAVDTADESPRATKRAKTEDSHSPHHLGLSDVDSPAASPMASAQPTPHFDSATSHPYAYTPLPTATPYTDPASTATTTTTTTPYTEPAPTTSYTEPAPVPSWRDTSRDMFLTPSQAAAEQKKLPKGYKIVPVHPLPPSVAAAHEERNRRTPSSTHSTSSPAPSRHITSPSPSSTKKRTSVAAPADPEKAKKDAAKAALEQRLQALKAQLAAKAAGTAQPPASPVAPPPPPIHHPPPPPVASPPPRPPHAHPAHPPPPAGYPHYPPPPVSPYGGPPPYGYPPPPPHGYPGYPSYPYPPYGHPPPPPQPVTTIPAIRRGKNGSSSSSKNKVKGGKGSRLPKMPPQHAPAVPPYGYPYTPEGYPPHAYPPPPASPHGVSPYAAPTTPTPSTTSSGRASRPTRSTDPVLSHEMSRCRTLVDTLMTWANSRNVFNQPVNTSDPTKIGFAPNYLNVVKVPMDLGTIRAKINEGEYPSDDHCLSDIRLVFNNAMAYNAATSWIHIAARESLDIVEREFAKSDIQTRRSKQSASIPGDEDTIAAVHGRLADVEASYAATHKRTKGTAVPLSGTTTPAAAAPLDPNIYATEDDDFEEYPSKKRSNGRTSNDAINATVALTQLEKENLKEDIFKLPSHKLTPVVEIISQSMPKDASRDEDDEIEIDIDKLSTPTLRKLQGYVRKELGRSAATKALPVSKPTTRKKGQATPIPPYQQSPLTSTGTSYTSSTSILQSPPRLDAAPDTPLIGQSTSNQPSPSVIHPGPPAASASASAAAQAAAAIKRIEAESDSSSSDDDSDDEDDDGKKILAALPIPTAANLSHPPPPPMSSADVEASMEGLDAARILDLDAPVATTEAEPVDTSAWSSLATTDTSTLPTATPTTSTSTTDAAWSEMQSKKEELEAKQRAREEQEAKVAAERERQVADAKREAEEKKRIADAEAAAKAEADRQHAEAERVRLEQDRIAAQQAREQQTGTVDLGQQADPDLMDQFNQYK